MPRLIAARLGAVQGASGEMLEPNGTLETMPSCLFDAVVVPGGAEGVEALSALGHALDFVKDQYRHCKAMLVLGEGSELLEKAGVLLDDKDPALVHADRATRAAIDTFIAAIGKHRNWDRAEDPPPV